MLFNSEVFLFLFLPVTLLLYYFVFLSHPLGKNIFLLAMSLLFYAYGEPVYVLLMIFMIAMHYVFAIGIDRNRKDRHKKKIILFLCITADILILGYFKYTNFMIHNINGLLGTSIADKNIRLPIGISFYTFQAISYVVDVYRKKVRVQRNPLYLGLYISLFPQLIAGPIVRYETIEYEIENRREDIRDFSLGVNRFIVGLGKKVLLANQFAVVADAAFNATSRSVVMAWLGAIAYTLQIFFDFAGYSDMAIGLGRMFVFHFLENFKYPYISKSITEFWRRWHMSLQTWFKDYVYIPLGGHTYLLQDISSTCLWYGH